MRFKWFVASSCTVFLFVPVIVAGAAPVNYSEFVSGDLIHLGFPLPVMSFDIGVNTVSGRFGIDATDTDVDSFAFTVPAGSQLVSGQVTLADFIGDIVESEWEFRSGSANVGGGAMLDLLAPNSPGLDTLGPVPQGPNVYNITQRGFFHTDPPCQADYTFTFVIQSNVPEPCSAGLILIGAMLLLGWRRR
jgi:hypothetical protein